MQIAVEIIDKNNQFRREIFGCNKFAFIKHMAMAGQGFMPSVAKYTRMVGMYCHYIEYLSSIALNDSHLSVPPPERQDPTEKGHVSNVVGKAIGDFLARRVSGAQATLNYEGAMAAAGHPIRGSRPDLYCVGNGEQFALEAKGYTAGSSGPMHGHKSQALEGPLPVNFAVASVSYDLYREIKVKYHDPSDDSVPFNQELNLRLLRAYYHGLFEYAQKDTLPILSERLGNVDCLFIRIIGPGTPYPAVFRDDLSLYLVLAKRFKRLSDESSQASFPDFLSEPIESDMSYLDTDGVGIALHTADF